MDPRTIREARRLLHDLVFNGQAQTSTGKIIALKDEVLVTMLEKIASKKMEESVAIPEVSDFKPQETYHEKPKDSEVSPDE